MRSWSSRPTRYAGGHTNTVDVGARSSVDTGFIVFNDRNYPNFQQLLRQLGVASQPSRHVASASATSDGDFEYASTSPNGLFAKRAHLASPTFHRMVLDVRRFQRDGARAAGLRRRPVAGASGCRTTTTPQAFVERLIVPQAAAVWSRRPGPDVVVPGALPGPVLRQPRDARPQATARAGARSPAAPSATSRRSPRPFADAIRLRHAASRSVHPRRRRRDDRRRALRPRRPRHPRRPGAGDPRRRRDARWSASCSARSPTRPTRRSCTTTSPAPAPPPRLGVAGTTTCSSSRPASRPSPTT